MADWVEDPHATSSVEYVDETLLSRARSGAVKVRRLQSGTKRVFHIVMRGLSPTRRDAVTTLYNSKRLTTLTLDWAPTSDTNIACVFGPNPITWTQEGNLWHGDVDLYEV